MSSGTRDSLSETISLADARWRRTDDAVVLIGSRCGSCGTTAFPAAEACGSCGGDDVQAVEIAPTGTLFSYTTIHVKGRSRQAPYTVGYVDFPEPVRVFGQVAIPSADLAIGLPVKCELGVVAEGADGEPVVSYRFVRA